MIVFDLLNFLVCCCHLKFCWPGMYTMLYRHPYYGPMGWLTKQYCSRQDKQPLLSLKKLVLVASLRWNSKFPIIWLFFQWPLQFCPYQYWHLVLLGLSWSCPLNKQRGAKASWVLDQSTPTEFLLIFNLYLLHCNSIIWMYACTSCTSADLYDFLYFHFVVHNI